MPTLSDPAPGGRRRFPVASAAAAADKVLITAAETVTRAKRHPDATLLAACAAFAEAHRRRDRLFHGPARIDDDDERSDAIRPFVDAAEQAIHQISDAPATTLDGHRARAAVFLLWDDGMVLGLAERGGFPEDRLLAALICDLLLPVVPRRTPRPNPAKPTPT